jgi:uncharacterized membrane protein
MFKFLVFLHLLSAIAAFGPPLVLPLLTRASTRAGAAQSVAALQRIVTPGLVGLIVFGAGAVGTSPGDVYSMSQAWISVAFLLAIIALAVVWFVLIPAQRRVADATSDHEASRDSRKASGMTGILHIILVIALVMMVWKPGL